jgi:hypothetical protein
LFVWLFLIGSLLVALSLPLLTLWYAAHSPLTAQVCLWPPSPQAHETVRLVVSVPNATDRDAVAGPWAHLHVAWNMVTMPMDTRPLDLAGTAEQEGTFSVPLQMDMAGTWLVELTLQTPGRPAWQTQVEFTVASSGGIPAVTPGPSGGTAPTVCDGVTYERKSSL